MDNTRAVYRVLNVSGFYGPDDHLHLEGDEIVYDGIPNEELEPLNDVAKERMIKLIETLDAGAREAAEKLGRSYIERPRSLDGGLSLASELQRANASIMGAKKENTGIERLEPNANVPVTGSISKRGPGRPRKIA